MALKSLTESARQAVHATARTPAGKRTPKGSQAGAGVGADPAKAALDPRVLRCRAMVSRKALLSAGISVIPVPGLDVAADVTLLMNLVRDINREFGLSEAQIEALSPSRRALAFKAIQFVGSSLIGSTLTRELILQVLRRVGMRFTTKQVTKYVPLAGQALSAALSYSAMRYVCNRHIEDCARVAAQLALPAPD